MYYHTFQLYSPLGITSTRSTYPHWRSMKTCLMRRQPMLLNTRGMQMLTPGVGALFAVVKFCVECAISFCVSVNFEIYKRACMRLPISSTEKNTSIFWKVGVTTKKKRRFTRTKNRPWFEKKKVQFFIDLHKPPRIQASIMV